MLTKNARYKFKFACNNIENNGSAKKMNIETKNTINIFGEMSISFSFLMIDKLIKKATR